MSVMTALAHGAKRLARPHRGERYPEAGRTAYPVVLRRKDLSAIPVCGQAVRPLASQRRPHR